MSAKAPRVLGIVPHGGRSKEGEVPIFSNVPIEGVEGIQENEKEPARNGASVGSYKIR